MRRLAILIAFVSGIPVFGLVVGGYIRAEYEKEWLQIVTKEAGPDGAAAVASGKLSLATICKRSGSEARTACDTYENVSLLFRASAWSLLVGLSLLGGIYLAARVAGANRALLVALFSPGLKLVLLILFGLILAQGAIVVYGTFIAEAYATKRVHGVVIFLLGLGAVIGAFSMIRAGLTIGKRARSIAIGKIATEKDQPELWALVKDLASRINAAHPKNIVLGIAPNFYVTSADVSVFPEGRKYSDETLYLSLPLLRVLSLDELKSVVGHELGHFKGADTAFSLRFYPIYAGTTQALASLQGRREGLQVLVLLPAVAILSFFMERFTVAQNTIGRGRELEADKIGASLGSPKALGTALLKLGVMAPVWPHVKRGMIDALAEGKMFMNISEFYAGAIANKLTADQIREVGISRVSHPTDTHPSTASRIDALGFSVESLIPDVMVAVAGKSSVQLIREAGELEKELSVFEHRLLVETGQVVVPSQGNA